MAYATLEQLREFIGETSSSELDGLYTRLLDVGNDTIDAYCGQSFDPAPADIVQACIEIAALKVRDRLSRSAGQGEAATWLPSFMPRSITEVLDRHRRLPNP